MTRVLGLYDGLPRAEFRTLEKIKMGKKNGDRERLRDYEIGYQGCRVYL
jgi:hypothetical protein